VNRRSILLCSAWIGACLLLSAALWFFTQSPRMNMLARQANRIIARTGDSRRLDKALGRAGALGTWFSLTEVPRGNAAPGKALVFTLNRGTLPASCAAFLDDSLKLEKIVPLSPHAEQVLEDLPGPLYEAYRERIESAAEAER